MQSMFSPTFRRLLLTALCASIAFAAGCARQKPAASPAKPRPLLVDGLPARDPKPARLLREKKLSKLKAPKFEIIQRGVNLRWDSKDGTQMTATVRSGDLNTITQVGTVLDFSAKLYENGKLTATVSAPRAIVDTAKRTIMATGGVTMRSLERETTVKSSWMKWNANTHKIVGNGGVTVRTANGRAEAAAFMADTAMKQYTLLSSGKGLDQ